MELRAIQTALGLLDMTDVAKWNALTRLQQLIAASSNQLIIGLFVNSLSARAPTGTWPWYGEPLFESARRSPPVLWPNIGAKYLFNITPAKWLSVPRAQNYESHKYT
jgi:hypothetical protein